MEKFSYVLAAFVVFTNTASSQSDYCRLPSCREPNHTMCKYTSSKPAAKCGKVESVGLSNDEIEELVNSHNYYRELVARGDEKRGNPGPQPRATNIGPLEWDQELASIAQRWANQCSFGHDKCRDVERFQVGQNIAQHSSTGVPSMEITNQVTSWYNEVDKLDRKNVQSFNPSNFQDVGHYTQLVWAKTTKIGCGAIRYRSNGWTNFFLVCNYGPSGNWIGQEIYKTS